MVLMIVSGIDDSLIMLFGDDLPVLKTKNVKQVTVALENVVTDAAKKIWKWIKDFFKKLYDFALAFKNFIFNKFKILKKKVESIKAKKSGTSSESIHINYEENKSGALKWKNEETKIVNFNVVKEFFQQDFNKLVAEAFDDALKSIKESGDVETPVSKQDFLRIIAEFKKAFSFLTEPTWEGKGEVIEVISSLPKMLPEIKKELFEKLDKASVSSSKVDIDFAFKIADAYVNSSVTKMSHATIDLIQLGIKSTLSKINDKPIAKDAEYTPQQFTHGINTYFRLLTTLINRLDSELLKAVNNISVV